MAAKFEIRASKAGQFNWVLKSQGRTLATGEGYTSRALAEKAIGSLRKAVATAAITDLTLTPAKSAGRAAAKTTKAGKKTVARAAKSPKKTRSATTKKSTSPRKRSSRSG